MVVRIDNVLVASEQFATGASLQDVVDAVRASHAAGRLVIALTVNGHRFDVAELSEALEKPVGASDEIEMETGAPRDIACQALGDLATAFGDARWQHTSLADRLATGEHGPAIQELNSYLELWRSCHQAISQCGSLLEQDLTSFCYHGLALEEYLRSAAGILRQIRDALSASDYVSLGDLVRYELPMLSETWQNIFEDLRVGVESGGA